MKVALRRCPVALLLTGLLSLSLPRPARADAEPPSRADMLEAKRHFTSAMTLFKAGRYQKAGEAFAEAYRLSHLPDLLVNLGTVAEKLDRPAEAVRHLERYLEERPQAVDRPRIEERMERLRAAAKAQEAAAAPAPDPDPVVAPQPPPPAPVSPAPAAPAPGPPAPRTPPLPALVIGGTGAVFLILGIGLGGGALAAAAEQASGERWNDALDRRGRNLEAAAIALDVIGVVALGVSGAWLGVWLSRRSREGRAALRLSPRGAGLALEGRF